MTVIPLLKVMMEKEGLISWVDRKGCQWRYGMDFYVPKGTELSEGGSEKAGNYLLITKIEDGDLASLAGLHGADRIVGVGDFLISEGAGRSRLLQELSESQSKEIRVLLKRENVLEEIEVSLSTPLNEEYIESLGWSGIKKAQLGFKEAFVGRTHWAISSLPRDKVDETRTMAVVYIIVLLLVVTLIRSIAKFYQTYLAQKIVQTGLNRLREDCFGHIVNMPMGFFAEERPSDMVSRLINDTGVMGKAIKIMLGKALREPMNALFFMGCAMWINWQLTLIFMCGAPMMLGLVGIFGKKMKKASRKSLLASSEMLAKLTGVLGGLKVVKVYNQQEREREAFGLLNKRLLKQQLKISKVEAMTSPVLEVLGMIAGSAALIAGVLWVGKGDIEAEGFFVLLILLGTAAESVRKTSDIWNKIQQANAASERVFGVMDHALEYEAKDGRELAPFRESIEFRDVVFTYPGAERRVLDGINLKVQAGHNIAIVGPNGSGKTTIMNLLPRFYNVDSGAILIDGVDIKSVTLKSLRERIGMVTQNVVTFNDTVAANIAYGRPDASKNEIIEAAKRSYTDEFISPLPDGYDTIIGEGGTGLSGGQLQRIVIARAILKNPEILIFDEATSQVDADSEAKIHVAIEEVMRERTSFIIAHRFSTVINADVIVVIDKGRIVAQGSHDELISSCDLYKSLYETQLITSK
jgi:ABC-type multidrug transport system fused ATPase/permease subunit